MVGGPAVLARNFAVMTGVNAGLQCAIKKARGGVEDVKGRRAATHAAAAAAACLSWLCAALTLPLRAAWRLRSVQAPRFLWSAPSERRCETHCRLRGRRPAVVA